MALFFIGMLEMIIMTVWTKLVTRTKVIASGAMTIVSILIWYYVLESIVANITNWWVVAYYALGCAMGTMASTYYYSLKEKKQPVSNELQN